MSRATDLLYVAELKRRGEYTAVAEQLKIILTTEDKMLLNLLDLQSVIQKGKDAGTADPAE